MSEGYEYKLSFEMTLFYIILAIGLIGSLHKKYTSYKKRKNIRQLRDKGDITSLINFLKSKNDHTIEVRIDIIQFLTELKYEKIIDLLIDMVKDPKEYEKVRKKALEILSTFPDENVLHFLTEILDDKSPSWPIFSPIASDVSSALESIGLPAMNYLIKILNNKDREKTGDAEYEYQESKIYISKLLNMFDDHRAKFAVERFDANIGRLRSESIQRYRKKENEKAKEQEELSKPYFCYNCKKGFFSHEVVTESDPDHQWTAGTNWYKYPDYYCPNCGATVVDQTRKPISNT